MFINLINANSLIVLAVIVGFINLFPPFIINVKLRNFLLILISIFFFINIIIIDYWFLRGLRINFKLIDFDIFSINFHLEALGLIFLNLISFFWICSLIYAISYFKVNKINNTRLIIFFLNLSVLIGCIISLSENLVTMFIFYELLTITTIPLVISDRESNNQRIAIKKYAQTLFISSSALFLPAIIYILTKTGTASFVTQGIIREHFTIKETIILLIMIILGVNKATVGPLHVWLPAAMIAHYPISALLHAVVVVKIGVFCILKILIYTFGLGYLKAIFIKYNYISIIPSITIFYSAIKSLRSNNIKTILAYSTVTQLNVALLSFLSFNNKALSASILHIISHSFNKICIFYAAGIFFSIKKTYKVEDLLGLSKSDPITSIILLVSGLSLIGFPPLCGFTSKFLVLRAVIDQRNTISILAIIISNFTTLLYILQISITIYSPVNKFQHNLELIHKKEFQNTNLSLMKISLCICFLGMLFCSKINRLIKVFLSYIDVV